MILIYACLFVLVVVFILSRIKIRNLQIKIERENYIKKFEYSTMISVRLKQQHYKYLSEAEINKIMSALKLFFLMVLKNKGKQVAMPSQAVDVAWHEFILCTKDYADFCQKAFGKFLHHTPTERMNSSTDATNGIINVWTLACQMDNIDPENPHKLPTIFSIDSELNIKNGFHYTLDCTQFENDKNIKYCVVHIAEQLKNARSSSSCSGMTTGDSGCGGGD